MPIHPKKKTTAKLRIDPATGQHAAFNPQNPRYMQVARGVAFRESVHGQNLRRELSKIQRKLEREIARNEQVQANPRSSLFQKNVQRHRVIHAQNRIATLQNIESQYVYQGVYQYIPPIAAQEFLYTE